MKLSIFRAEINCGLGIIEMAVESTENDARRDMYTAAEGANLGHPGQLRICNLRRSNRRIIANMSPVRHCWIGDEEYWAWTGDRVK